MEALAKEPIRLLEIEKELAGPGAHEAMERYDAMLAALGSRIDEAISQGLAPDEYEKAVMLREANVIARKILRLTVRVGS